ncbi:MAG: ABC transporter ATP-binding protein [Promethearchaeota archaeon]
MPYIELKELKKEFDIGDYVVIALENINISVDKDEFINIEGASGAGKTSLLNIIASLDKPTSGKVLIDGVDVTALSEESLAPWRAINLGFVFQSFNLISTLTAEENIALPAVFWRKDRAGIDQRVNELLELVEMSDRREHLPVQLSAGEKQRIAIARALVNNPPLIIADEPTANLDAKTAGMIVDLFSKVWNMDEKTIIVASHDDRMAGLATRKLMMDAGNIQEI